VLDQNRAPIFVLGLTHRSGTLWLRNLLLLHSDCAGCPPGEDWLIGYAHLLARYVMLVSRHWKPRSEVKDEWLYEGLGRGLLGLWEGRTGEKRLVTRTPSVRNLRIFAKLLPQAFLLVIVRDGRAVVESSVKTFDRYHETYMRSWARAAREALDFQEGAKYANSRCLFIRYEDLFTNLETELHRIFNFIGLSAASYNFEAAKHLPVRGSSSTRTSRSERVHWQPVEKTGEFDPLSRWHHWSRGRHERFNWIAGLFLQRFGYEPVRFDGYQAFWALANRFLDFRWWIKSAPRTFFRSLIEQVVLSRGW
jgi:hypothetical protein